MESPDMAKALSHNGLALHLDVRPGAARNQLSTDRNNPHFGDVAHVRQGPGTKPAGEWDGQALTIAVSTATCV
jgi:hypothetical protein